MNKPSLFITGAGGFLGNALLAALDSSKFEKIVCLVRKMENIHLTDNAEKNGNIHVIEGDLLDVARYEHVLKETDTVIHMAAVTGKVLPKDYFKVNAYATMLLLDRCKQAGVKHFLFVSSIAVAFKNKFRYFYAHSKEQAENYVKSSGIKYTIIRPTMIMGKNAPVFDGLARLTRLPIIPVFGKGNVQIQPIHVADAAKAIRNIIEAGRFHDETLEVGGPETISIENFMKKIANSTRSKSPSMFHLPLGLIVFFLAIMEHFVYRFLPLTVGQLASFRNDGIAEHNTLTDKMNSLMKNLDEIISDSLATDTDDTNKTDIPPAIVRECNVFCKYLVNQSPNNYILEKYYRCNHQLNFRPADFHDGLLLKLACKTKFLTRMTDVYSRFFRPTSIVRKKLAYLMAILEASPPYFMYYDSTDGPGLIGFAIRMGIKGTGMVLHLFISFFLLFPFQILAKLTGKKDNHDNNNNIENIDQQEPGTPKPATEAVED